MTISVPFGPIIIVTQFVVFLRTVPLLVDGAPVDGAIAINRQVFSFN